MTRLDCLVIEHEPFPTKFTHPSWWKHMIHEMHAFLPGKEWMYFDADIICLKPWNPKEIFEKNSRKLCAVRDNNPAMAAAVREEEKAIGIPKGTYLNAGLFMFGREHARVFEATWAKRPAWHRWIDQSAWNRALYDLKVLVAVLPEHFNEMNHEKFDDATNFHYHSLDGDWKKLQQFQQRFIHDTENDIIGRSSD